MSNFFIFLTFKKIKKKGKTQMEILRIRSRIPIATLLSVCAEDQIIIIPVAAQDGHNGEEHQSYINVSLQDVNPLGQEGCSYFRGKTVSSNGEKPVNIDGATLMFSKVPEDHNYGY